jgi:acyl-lipid omega-6 desaturase (Delta-12 desaturase)
MIEKAEQLSLDIAQVKKVLHSYQQPDVLRSVWQLINTILPYFFLWYMMYLSLRVSYILTLGLAVLAAGFMVRSFIIFHDCGHGSFFKSRRANDAVGIVTGLFTLTPYYRWRHDHAIHHATAGDLDRRGTGDVMTITLKEYQELSKLKKFYYRFFRHPIVLFLVGPLLVFAVGHRFSSPKSGKRERWSVYYTNLALAGIITGMIFLVGWKAFLLIQLPILFIGTSVGVWLFYIQHNFKGTYWERHDQWDFFHAGLLGSSFYKLPLVFQWFSGNIGFHHIHHMNSKIPNYLLPRCHRENPIFQVKPLTFMSSLNCLKLRFWDEENQCMVGFEALKKMRYNPSI